MVAIEQDDTVHVMVELHAPELDRADRRGIDAVAVIDRSGSMGGEPLAAAKLAVEQLVRMLGRDDRLGVVVYDDEVEMILGLSRHDTDDATQRIRSVRPGASTNLEGGWLKGFEILAARGRADATRKVLLLTDGLANVGATDPAQLAAMCAAGVDKGIGTSTIGFGLGFDEALLAAMADAGDGNDYFAASAEDLPRVFADEFADLGLVVANNVSIEIETESDVAIVDVFTDRPCVALDNGVQVALGDAYGGERRRLVFALRIPGLAALGNVRVAQVVLRYATTANGPALHTVTMPVVVNVVGGATGDADWEVTEEVLRLSAARARLQARTQLLDDDPDAAAATLKATAARLLDLAPPNAHGDRLRADAAELLGQAAATEVEPPTLVTKTLYASSRRDYRSRMKRPPRPSGESSN
jgi:Ca-activated chloride channel family protein